MLSVCLCSHVIIIIFILHIQNARVLFRQRAAVALGCRGHRLLPAASANQGAGLHGQGTVQRALELGLSRDADQSSTKVKSNHPTTSPHPLRRGRGTHCLFASVPGISYISQNPFQVTLGRRRHFGSTFEQTNESALIFRVLTPKPDVQAITAPKLSHMWPGRLSQAETKIHRHLWRGGGSETHLSWENKVLIFFSMGLNLSVKFANTVKRSPTVAFSCSRHARSNKITGQD